MSSVNQTVSGPLAAIGEKALKLFDDTILLCQRGTEAWIQSEALFAAQRDRFKIWAIDLGLLVPGHGSLDYRVREAEGVAQSLKSFLEDLVQSLEEVATFLKDDHGRDSANELEDGDEEEDAEESLASLLLDSVTDIINRLFKLSTKIRHPSARLLSAKALRYKQVDETTGADLITSFEHYDLDYVHSIFSQYTNASSSDMSSFLTHSSEDSSWHKLESCTLCHTRSQIKTEDDEAPQDPASSASVIATTVSEDNYRKTIFLIHRIARANVQRRQQFGYWRSRRDKFARLTQEALSNGSRRAPTVTTATILPAALLNTPETDSTYSATEYATEYAPSAPDLETNSKPAATTTQLETVDFPPAPKIESTELYFNCPYCFTPCQRATLSPRAWKAHLIRDLRPYICTYEHCKTGSQLFDTRQAWIQHERETHQGKKWRCPTHPETEFLDITSFQAHVRDNDSVHEASSTTFVKSCESASSLTDRACPICRAQTRTIHSLQTHLARHLERMALFSLPRSTELDEDDKDVDAESDHANVSVGDALEDELASISSLGSVDILIDESRNMEDADIQRVNDARKPFESRQSGEPPDPLRAFYPIDDIVSTGSTQEVPLADQGVSRVRPITDQETLYIRQHNLVSPALSNEEIRQRFAVKERHAQGQEQADKPQVMQRNQQQSETISKSSRMHITFGSEQEAREFRQALDINLNSEPNPIPAHAKWTKINRDLVHPRVLEEAGEGFEERDLDIILLRVATREEIQEWADATKQLYKRDQRKQISGKTTDHHQPRRLTIQEHMALEQQQRDRRDAANIISNQQGQLKEEERRNLPLDLKSSEKLSEEIAANHSYLSGEQLEKITEEITKAVIEELKAKVPEQESTKSPGHEAAGARQGASPLGSSRQENEGENRANELGERTRWQHQLEDQRRNMPSQVEASEELAAADPSLTQEKVQRITRQALEIWLKDPGTLVQKSTKSPGHEAAVATQAALPAGPSRQEGEGLELTVREFHDRVRQQALRAGWSEEYVEDLLKEAQDESKATLASAQGPRGSDAED